MRKELKHFDWYVYGLSRKDLKYTIELVKTIFDQKALLINQEWEKVRLEEPELADDIMDDIAHYSWVEAQYLWSFCLWRLQGIFEGIITKKYINSDKSFQGLKAKITELKKLGFQISDSEKNQLIEWAKLRNALSHMPPEQYRPAMIMEEDIHEYYKLIDQLLEKWDLVAEEGFEPPTRGL